MKESIRLRAGSYVNQLKHEIENLEKVLSSYINGQANEETMLLTMHGSAESTMGSSKKLKDYVMRMFVNNPETYRALR